MHPESPAVERTRRIQTGPLPKLPPGALEPHNLERFVLPATLFIAFAGLLLIQLMLVL